MDWKDVNTELPEITERYSVDVFVYIEGITGSGLGIVKAKFYPGYPL
jgi:hypothetical protein